VLALIVTTLYSGMFAGVLPTTEILQRNISWESHLIGGIVGIFVAYFFKEELEEDEHNHYDMAGEDQKYFFERDIFENTKEERWIKEEERRRIEEEMSRRSFPPYDWFSNSTL
jgi:hypothetical protein